MVTKPNHYREQNKPIGRLGLKSNTPYFMGMNYAKSL